MLVWAYCKDPGGTAGMMPVVRELHSRGVVVRLFAEGAALQICEREGLPTETPLLEQLALHDELPKLFVTAMCSGGGLGRDLVPHLRPRGVWCVALQDSWGARLMTDWADTIYRPHDIVVNDHVGEAIVNAAWQDWSGVIVSGYPALDRFAGIDPALERQLVRDRYGIPRDARVILFGGQVKGTSAVLAEAIAAVRQVGGCFLVPRRHPRLPVNAPDDARRWEEIMGAFPKDMLLPQLDAATMDEALAVSDVVVAAFSTVLVEASVMRKPAIAVLMPETGMKRFREETGGIMEEHPLVSLGCVAKATSHEELVSCIAVGLAGHPRRLLQERAFQVDGKNAARLVDVFMESLKRA